jgi:rRNA-processing protein FCF1
MDCIVVDTSSVIYATAHRKDICESLLAGMGLKAVVSSGVLRELRKIGGGKGSNAGSARAGAVLLKNHGVKVINNNSYVDIWIEEYALRHRLPVCTNDTKLKKRLSAEGLSVFSVSSDGKIR